MICPYLLESVSNIYILTTSTGRRLERDIQLVKNVESKLSGDRGSVKKPSLRLKIAELEFRKQNVFNLNWLIFGKLKFVVEVSNTIKYGLCSSCSVF